MTSWKPNSPIEQVSISNLGTEVSDVGLPIKCAVSVGPQDHIIIIMVIIIIKYMNRFKNGKKSPRLSSSMSLGKSIAYRVCISV